MHPARLRQLRRGPQNLHQARQPSIPQHRRFLQNRPQRCLEKRRRRKTRPRHRPPNRSRWKQRRRRWPRRRPRRRPRRARRRHLRQKSRPPRKKRRPKLPLRRNPRKSRRRRTNGQRNWRKNQRKSHRRVHCQVRPNLPASPTAANRSATSWPFDRWFPWFCRRAPRTKSAVCRPSIRIVRFREIRRQPLRAIRRRAIQVPALYSFCLLKVSHQTFTYRNRSNSRQRRNLAVGGPVERSAGSFSLSGTVGGRSRVVRRRISEAPLRRRAGRSPRPF